MANYRKPRDLAQTSADAQKLRHLYHSPEVFRVVNVWDAVSARVISDLPGTTSIATAGHSIAAMHGYADGENIPVDLMLATTAEIVAATNLPVSADLDGGFGDPVGTVLRAIEIGVSGANVEDQMRPFDESVAQVEAIVKATDKLGVPFALNARTDAVVKGGNLPMEEKLQEAIRRGKAYLEAGATSVFVPGVLDEDATKMLVAGLGKYRLSVIGLPGALRAEQYEALGVAKVSYGPMPQNVVLTALKSLGTSLLDNGVIPEDTQILNNL